MGAWATEYTITYDTSTGTFYRSGSASTDWSSKWVSNEAGKPVVTISTSVNNMNGANGRIAPQTYTISVEEGYVVTGFSFNNCPTFGGEITLTPSGESATVVAENGKLSVTSSASSFVFSGGGSCRIQAASSDGGSFTITVENPSAEQIAAYNTAKGWTTSIFTAEGLVKDASNYSGNAIIPSADGGGLPALLDNNTSTYCHTAYSGSGTADPGADHYIQAYVEAGADAFYLYTYRRTQNTANRPTQIDITASNDGSSWTDITSLTSGLTTNDDFLSDKISLGATYKYIRFTVPTTNTGAAFNGHVFFTYSEFWLLPSNSHVDDAIAIVKTLPANALGLTSEQITNINAVDLAVRTATIAPWKAAFIASAGESSNFGKVGWPSASAYSTFCDAINALTVDDDYETDGATAMATLWGTVTYPATGYYYLHNLGTGRYAFSDETISSSQDFTNDESRTSKYVWKVTLDGTSVKVYQLTGHGITLNNNGGEQTGNLALETPDANSYTAARGAFYMGCIQDPNQNSFTPAGTAYVSATNPMKLTHWNGDRNNSKAYWVFEPVDASAYDVYTVNFVNAPGDNYVTYTGSSTTGNKKVWDGGQYFMTKDASVVAGDFTAETAAGYDVEVTISSKTITVTYTMTDYAAIIEAYFDTEKQTNFANAGKVGYMQNSGDDFTNLSSLLMTFADPAHVYTESDYNNLVTYYEACAANVKYPETGKYYLVKNNYNGKYMRVTASGTRGTVFADLTAAEAAKDASAHFCFVENASKLYMSTQGEYLNWVYNSSGYEGFTSENFDKYVHFANPAVGLIAFSIALGNGEDSYAGYLNPGFYALFNESTKVVGGSSDGAASNKAQWVFEEVSTMNIDLHSDGAGTPTYYATLCLPFDATITSGADAYTLSKSGDYLVPAAVADNEVPAGTPVLLKGTTGSTATASINTTGVAFNSGSPLDCALTGTYFAKTIDGATDYVLGIDGGVVGFYHWNTSTLGANRAYYDTPAGVKGFVVMFDDDATGINSIENGQLTIDNEIYNLAGQRMGKMQKGINIVNGKKVLF